MKLVILDRDGVINVDSAQFIKSPAEWKPIPGSLEAIAKLNQSGYKVVIATNQSGVGRSLFDMDTLNSIHEKMHKALFTVGGRVDAVFYCPHTADSDCACRKPKPGMFKRISEIMNTDLKGVPAIGDSLRDLQAGARCRLLAAAGADRQGTKRPWRKAICPPARESLPIWKLRSTGFWPGKNHERDSLYPVHGLGTALVGADRTAGRRRRHFAARHLGLSTGQALASGDSMGRREPARHSTQGHRP
jgi:D-glycero-D-manno-heptose 1,7-bisphosphate phosphatase